MTTSDPSVAIILLNWNGGEDTLACLASLKSVDYPDFKVLVVDNGSTDGSLNAIRGHFPEIVVLELGQNLGFVQGNNIGLEWAIGQGFDFALLLNNDTWVSSEFLTSLAAALRADDRVAAAGPTIYYADQPDVIWSAGGEIDWKRGRTFMRNMDERDHGQLGGAPREVDFVTGCALLVRLEVVRRIGLLDPRFFAYYEETEWCLRMGRAGYRILHVPSARIWHRITPQAREASPRVAYYMARNRLLFLKLARAGVRSWFYTLFLDYARTLLSWTIKPRWRNKSQQRRAMIQGILDYSRGHFAEWN